MWMRPPASRPLFGTALAATFLGALFVSGIQAAPAAKAKPKATATPAKAAAPADDKPQKDEEGRVYHLEKLEKIHAVRLDPKTVRTKWGIPIQVVKEDAKYYYYKVYEEPKETAPAPSTPMTQKEPTAEDKAKVAATYATDVQPSDRLRFVSFGAGLPTSGQWRDGFDIADMNGDGKLDIVHGPPRKGLSAPVIFLGDGKGNWQRWRNTAFPPLAYDYGDAVVADFNKDGHPDIALGMHLRGTQVLLGDGKGHFTNWSEGLDFSVPGTPGAEAGGGGYSSKALAVADWNGDGRPDLLALGEGPRLNLSGGRAQGQLAPSQSYGVVIYLNQGNGKWVRKDQGTNGGANLFGDSLAVGDFNGDHRVDFATGSGVQGRKDLVDLGKADGGWEAVTLDQVRPSSYINAVHAVDLDHDGRTDLVVAYTSFELGVWRTGIDLFYSRPGDKWERRALVVEEDRTGVFAVASGDLDGDGNLDLVALTGNGRTWIFLGDGKGSFTREKTGVPPYPGGCRGYDVRLKDLDGDGKDEIVSSFAGEGSPLATEEGCPSGGGLTAWHLAKAAHP